MSRSSLFLILAALCLLPTGCVFLDTPPQTPFSPYPFRYNRSDFKIAWKTVKLDTGVEVEVMLKNLRYASVSGLTLETSLNRGGKVILTRRKSLPQRLRTGEFGKVVVKLEDVVLSSGDQLHFLVGYKAGEGNTARIMATEFTIDAVTGVIHEDLSSPD